MYKKIIEHEKIKGFYKHSKLEYIYISKNGDVYNDKTQKYLYPAKSMGYLRISSLNEKTVHRLVCETFLIVPENIEQNRLVVNHKNGIRNDNRLENLEWTSFSGNSKHAYESGFRKDNTPILIKDLRTGNIVKHYSLQQAARMHSVNGANISWYLKPKKIGNVFQKYYVIIREGMAWPDTGPEAMGFGKNGLAREVILFDKKIWKWFIFKNMKDTGEYLNIKENTIGMRMRRVCSKGLTGYEDKDICIWFLDMYKKDIPKNIEYIKSNKSSFIRNKTLRKAIPISITNLETNETQNFNSSEHFARSVGIKKNTFQKHIYQNKGIWKSKYCVQYLK